MRRQMWPNLSKKNYIWTKNSVVRYGGTYQEAYSHSDRQN